MPTPPDLEATPSSPDQAWSGPPAVRGRKPQRDHGFTLLEVILAIAILGIALATLGQSVGRSHDNARRAADRSEITLAAQTVLDEMLSGIRPLEPLNGLGIGDPLDPSAPAEIVVSAAIEASQYDGLLILRVQAKPNVPDAGPLETVELVRWLVDPSLEESADAEGGAP